ncbi:MAG: SurA N-terminal domain-containing protein [Alistipes sp.]|nr:SurA N-terminal domain-containing protein [Alistipes sp.]
MATLNTLRTRGGVIVSIVIGVALLAFLLGDFGTTGANMMNDRKMKVGQINGKKIGYVEFDNRVNHYIGVLETMSGSKTLSTEQQDNVRNQVWETLIMENAWLPGMEKSGLQVSEAEQIDMVDGVYISPVIRSAFSNPSTGSFDVNVLHNFIANMDKDATGQAMMIWNFLKDQMNQQRQFGKFASLIGKGMYVTDLEVEQGVANSDQVNNIAYVMKGYDQIADSTLAIPTAEVQKYYDAHKETFRRSAGRDVEYVMFEVLPSAADNAAAEKEINELATEFAVSENPMQYASLNSQVQPNKNYFAENQLPAELAAYAFGTSEGIYGPVKEADTYTLSRVADTKMISDSLGARHILLDPAKKELADSILTALKGGAAFADLSALYSQDEAAKAQGGDLGIFTPERMVPEFTEAVMNTEKGGFFKVETQFGLHVGEVTYKSAPKKKVQMATITYRIEPSEATQQEIYAKVSKFMGEATGSYANFEKAATDNSLSKRVVRIRNTDHNVNGIDNSREIVRWAYNGKKGDISSIFEVDGNYVIAALTGVSEDGIASMEEVAPQIIATLRLEKKGEMVAAEMTGASLGEVASKLNMEPKTADNIDFNSFYIEGVGVEPKLIGAVAGAKEGVLSKPVVGAAGVYRFDVTSRTQIENVTPESEKTRLQTNAQAYLMERLNQALVARTEVMDFRAKFF